MPEALTHDLARRLVAGDRRALARSITLIESTRHSAEAGSLLDSILGGTGGSIRLGVSGTPGVGKSTFINSLGQHLIANGKSVAVLAVDPTSERTGGSILGDKTRMGDLVSSEKAFIRPSPTSGNLGGVARRTADALLLCEAAGYDVVIVETVGVGQSETAVADITDLFLLLLAPGGGDDLQGIKRGVMELADLVAVNKADGDLVVAAERTAGDYRAALSLVRPKRPDRPTQVVTCSSIGTRGVDQVWDALAGLHAYLVENGLETERQDRREKQLWAAVSDRLLEQAMAIRSAGDELELARVQTRRGTLSITSACSTIVDGVNAANWT